VSGAKAPRFRVSSRGEKTPMPEAPAAPTSRAILRALGIAGWSALEPAILAALATESPILLIGPHGTTSRGRASPSTRSSTPSSVVRWPALTGTGIPTLVIADRYKAGESIADLARDYDRPEDQIEEAIRCELALPTAA
jgi:uncharacterized protein (DUF433 family)